MSAELMKRQVDALTEDEAEVVCVLAVCSMDCARSQSDDETGFFEPPCDCGAVEVQKKLDEIRLAAASGGGDDTNG